MSLKKRGLGKGLDALLGGSQAAVERQLQPVEPENGLLLLAVERLCRGVYQPRRDMSDQALEELASSIKVQGVIQPIIVRPIADAKYEIIAGERRWRAAQLAGLTDVPCIVNPVEDNAAIAIALIENIQREDLNAMEEAIALKRLADEFELTHAQVAEAVGKSRAAVSNLMRLNGLNDEVKTLLEHGDLEMGHARALLALTGDQQNLAARQVISKDLNVRETEKLVQKFNEPPINKVSRVQDPDIRRLAEQLTEQIGAVVAINHSNKGKGKLVINYCDLEQLDLILERLAPNGLK